MNSKITSNKIYSITVSTDNGSIIIIPDNSFENPTIETKLDSIIDYMGNMKMTSLTRKHCTIETDFSIIQEIK